MPKCQVILIPKKLLSSLYVQEILNLLLNMLYGDYLVHLGKHDYDWNGKQRCEGRQSSWQRDASAGNVFYLRIDTIIGRCVKSVPLLT
jgi:hypothetical protein